MADPIPDVYVDPDRILQALLNLLSNAAKFAPSGTADVTRGGDKFRFVVTDHGLGIPPDKMNRLFRRFQQLDACRARRLRPALRSAAVHRK